MADLFDDYGRPIKVMGGRDCVGDLFDSNGRPIIIVLAEADIENDHNFSGPSCEATAGETLTIFQAVYQKSDGKFWKADADASSTMPVMALASAAIVADAEGVFILPGSYVRDDTWNWTVGGAIYASTTAGGLTQTAPTGTDDIVQVVGWAYSADIMYFIPSLAKEVFGGLNITNDGTKTTLLGVAGDYIRIGDAGTTGYSLNSEDDLMVTGDLEVNGVTYLDGQVVTGGYVVLPYARNHFGGNFTSGGGAAALFGNAFDGVLTAINGDTNYTVGTSMANAIVTQNNSETIGYIAQLRVNEPYITKGNDTVTVAATLYIVAAPDEGATNAAIYVASGDIRTAGNNAVIGATTTGANGFVLTNPKNAAATALSGTQLDVEIDIAGTPYHFTVYPTKA